MNESNTNNAFTIINICRVCLRTTNDLTIMSNEHLNLFRSIVDELLHIEHSMKTCTICFWMFQRFNKFKHQCQSANNLLKEAIHMDSKSLVFLPNLTSSHQLMQTKTESHYFPPFTHANETFVNDTFLNDTFVNNTNDNNDQSINDPNKYKIIKIDNEDKLICDTYISHGTFNIAINDMKNDNDTIIDETYENVAYENDTVIDDEDEIPLVLLSKSVERVKKKSKKKKKIKKEIHMENDQAIKEESNIQQGKDSPMIKVKRTKKEPRAGFTSRMVQETDEYVVIKLTREQVLQEMADRTKTDAFLRSPFKCEKCVKGFNFEDVLQTHLDKHSTKNGAFQCDMCGQYCPSAVSLRGHVKSHTTRYKCKLCGHVRLSRQHLLEHHAITHTNAATAYNCDYCQFTTNKRTVMQRHVRRHAAGEPHACHKCGKLFQTMESLRLHTVRHDKSSRFKCDRCDNTFVYHSLLRRHIQCVHERREFYCVECDVQFKCAESLRLHFKKAKRHRDSSAYKHVCTHCGARFFSPSSLAAHLSSTHDVPKTHACPHCRRLYSSRDAVRAHAWRVHSRGDSPASCTQCGTSFARQSTLKLHIRSHAGSRPHSCACAAAFAQTNTLHAHVMAKHKKDENGEMQLYENKNEV